MVTAVIVAKFFRHHSSAQLVPTTHVEMKSKDCLKNVRPLLFFAQSIPFCFSLCCYFLYRTLLSPSSTTMLARATLQHGDGNPVPWLTNADLLVKFYLIALGPLGTHLVITLPNHVRIRITLCRHLSEYRATSLCSLVYPSQTVATSKYFLDSSSTPKLL